MTKPLRLGIAGLGTVGGGVVMLLREHAAHMASRLGREVEVVAVSARDRNKQRAVALKGVDWVDDPVKLAGDERIDVLVELIGGAEGTAKSAVERALQTGKHVVTANKALIAAHGVSLAEMAEKRGVGLKFEAAVAGGIPVIKTLRESLLANRISRVYGILNGTCNFILTKMLSERRAFGDVLAEAQKLGYAEADPTFDIGGFDTAHKLAILASLAFSTRIAPEEIDIEGIESITSADIEAAEDLGYRIKLLGVAQATDSGIEQRVHPAMVPVHSAIAEVGGVTNCVAIDADYVGALTLVGPGAGQRATASSVVSDIADIAKGDVTPPFITPSGKLVRLERAALRAHAGGYYIRLAVYDRHGAFAAIAGSMAGKKVSLDSIVQKRPRGVGEQSQPEVASGQPTPVVLITHETTEAAIRAALDEISKSGHVAEKPQMIRIEKL
ncbi:MAG: homoserine dehydrogenase [Hyphomicrobiaceae bacterium]